jgi:hypothetical protein
VRLAYKEGERNNIANYRPLSMMTTILKLYEKILDRRLRAQIIPKITPLQGACQENKGSIETLAILQNLIHQNKNTQTILCAYDLSKAYDRVNRDLLWKKLRKMKVEDHLLRAIKSTYSNSMTKVEIGKYKSTPEKLESGIKQGSVLSPILFIAYVNDIYSKGTRQQQGRTTTNDGKRN